MRIAVLGAGGIGGYYGGLLAHSNHTVHLLARGENLAVLRERGLEVRSPERSFVVRVEAADHVEQFGTIDWAMVAVKTYSLEQIGPAAKSLAQNGALILPLLNGVDSAERLVECGVPKENVLGGLTTISAERIGPGIFERHGTFQKVVLGEFNHGQGANTSVPARRARVNEIAEAFSRAGVETQISGDIPVDLWRKFAFIAPLAAACGLSRSPIGPIRRTPLGRLLLERAIREVIAVGQARGVALADDEVSRILRFCDSLPESNKPSLLRDLEASRPTEIDDLSGAVARMGRLAGVNTPVHDTAAAAIGAASFSLSYQPSHNAVE